jgi:hemerythrin-like domain-containing protein
MHEAVRKLRDEHRSISAVLSALRQLARMAQDAKLRPDFTVLRAMIFYIDTYPERLHHPKEDQYLFALLEQRAPQSGVLLASLRQEHVAGVGMVRDLERALIELEQTWPRGAAQFTSTVDAYAEFHWKHMRAEEQEVLPLAEQALTADDWARIEAAFAANEDPVAGLAEQNYEDLFKRIVSLAPAPIGLGERWKGA